MPSSDGRKNLRPQNTRTKEEQREIARMGGKASGIARRKKRTMQETLRFIATMPMKQGNVDSLDDLGTIGKASKGANLTAGDQLGIKLFKKAEKGDIKAMELFFKLLGEDNMTNAVNPLENLAKDIEKFKDEDDGEEE